MEKSDNISSIGGLLFIVALLFIYGYLSGLFPLNPSLSEVITHDIEIRNAPHINNNEVNEYINQTVATNFTPKKEITNYSKIIPEYRTAYHSTYIVNTSVTYTIYSDDVLYVSSIPELEIGTQYECRGIILYNEEQNITMMMASTIKNLSTGKYMSK